MANELRAAIVARLSDDALQQATEANRITAAWLTFLGAVKELALEPSLTIIPAKDQPVRRRRGRPRLHVAEPPTAA